MHLAWFRPPLASFWRTVCRLSSSLRFLLSLCPSCFFWFNLHHHHPLQLAHFSPPPIGIIIMKIVSSLPLCTTSSSAMSMIFALIIVILLAGTSSLPTVSAVAPNNGDDKNVEGQIHHNILLLRGGSVGGAAVASTIPIQEEHATIQNDYSSGSTCTTSCTNGNTCTPGSDRCSRILSQVCGCDGNTYSNKCEAFKSGVNVAYSGRCDTKEVIIDDNASNSMARMIGEEEVVLSSL
jgi:hypothetical protein